MTQLAADHPSAAAFLETLFPEGPWTVVAIDPAAREARIPTAAGTFDREEVSELVAFLDRYSAKNLYYAVNVADPTVSTTPTKTELRALRALHVDVDLPKGEPVTQAALARALAAIRALPAAPTAIVFSGGGYQAVWRLATPLSVDSILRVEAANRTILAATGGDPACFNVNRLFRLPGTVNHLSAVKIARGREPTLASLVEITDSTWAIEEVINIDIKAIAIDRHNKTIDSDSSEASISPLTDENHSVADLSARLRKTIQKGDPTEWNGDRSDMTFYVACGLVRQRWSDAEILVILRSKIYVVFAAHVAAQSNPDEYALRQVARARALIARDWRRNHLGQILTSSRLNVLRGLDEIGARFSYDTFAGKEYVNGAGPLRQVNDPAVVELKFEIDEHCGFVPDRDMFHDCVTWLTRRTEFHPVIRYLDELAYDGIPRIDTWLIDYAGAEDTPYTRAVSRLILIGAVHRVREPGCKFDQMLVMVDPTQGTGKSSAVQALAVDMRWFSDSVPFTTSRPKEVIEQLSGKWIVESSDLATMNKRAVEDLKAFLSKRYDGPDRMAFAHYPIEVPRQCVFFGTTNNELFLVDDQNRRFWPVRTTKVDLDGLRTVVPQLWAEANARFLAGETDELDPDLWEAAAIVQEEAKARDPWEDVISEALGAIEGRISNRDVLTLTGKPEAQQVAPDNVRVSKIMRTLGWEHKVAGGIAFGNKSTIVYQKFTPDPDTRGRQIPQRISVYRDPVTNRVVVDVAPDPEVVRGLVDPATIYPPQPTPPPDPLDADLSF